MDPIWQDLPLDIVLQHILPKFLLGIEQRIFAPYLGIPRIPSSPISILQMRMARPFAKCSAPSFVADTDMNFSGFFIKVFDFVGTALQAVLALGEARSRFHNVNNGGKAKPNVGIKTQKGVVSRIHDLVFSLGHLQAACRQSCCTTVVNLTFLTFLSCCRCVGERQGGAMRNSIFGPG